MITGRTKLFCIVADPIAHVKTPEVFNAFLNGMGVDAVLVPAHVPAGKLEAAVGGLRALENLRGIIVTIPHKIAISTLCDELDETARVVGAVNIIKRDGRGRLIGANFDGLGFVNALQATAGSIAGKSIFIAGAGGAARAIAFGVARAGVGRLTLYNRTPSKSASLIADIAKVFPRIHTSSGDSRPAACDIAVNATSLGLHANDPLPFSIDALPGHATVAEVVMQPIMTPLLVTARKRGLVIMTGEAMLERQLHVWMDFMEAEWAGTRAAVASGG